MDELIRILVEYASIWAPSLVAILSLVVTVITSIKKFSAAITEFKDDKAISELTSKVSKLVRQNEELSKCNKLLLDNITRIQGYVDTKLKE